MRTYHTNKHHIREESINTRAIKSIPVNGEIVEITQSCTYLDNVIPFTGCELDVNRRLGQTWSAKVRVFHVPVFPVLMYSC